MKAVLMIAALAFCSAPAFAGSLECKIQKYNYEDKPYGKGTLTECGTVSISMSGVENNAAFLANCDDAEIAAMNLGNIGGLRIGFRQLLPGSSDWKSRESRNGTEFVVLKEEDVPAQFSVSFSDYKRHSFSANESINYTAVCVKK